MDSLILVSGISLPLWFLLSYLLQIKTNLEIHYITRIYSNIHAIIAILNAIGYLLNLYNESYFLAINGITISHALNDSLYLIKNKDYILLTHHILMIIGVIFSYYSTYNKYKTFLAFALLSETSTIFLNNSWILLKNNNTKNIHFTFNTYMTLICFFIFRIINITVLFFMIILDKQYLICFLLGPLNYFNYTWFYKLLKKRKELSS